MFIKVTQSGARRYAQLVESFRNEDGKPRQRTVCTLGRLEDGGEVDNLIAALQRARGITPTPSPLEGLRFTDSRHAGDVWALSELWRSLGFDDLASAWRRSKTETDVLGCLRLMVFNRLCDPSSKLGVLRWLDTVALPVGVAKSLPEHQHLLRAMDVLDEYSDTVGERLATLMRPLIDQDLSVVFYDLTTVSVTGQTDLDEDVRAYGRAKSGLVERQFMLSLVQTAEGLPIAHEVHPGNTAEAKTLLPMIRKLLARYPLKRVVLVADRGLLSVGNLEELDELQAQLKQDGRDVALEYILSKCIYTRLGWPARNGGLERAFIHWAQADSHIQAFCKISENRHTFARLRYVKEDGLPAFYSPDFLVRTADAVYLAETKAQQQTMHPNVQRKLKAALAWCGRINALTTEQRGGPPWHYVLLAENVVVEWQAKGARLAELLDYARLRPLADASLQARLL